MKAVFLVENKTEHPDYKAEHGLSLYIEAGEKRILFDAGASDILISNAANMGVDLSSVDIAVISHGHFDHTGGIPAFIGINDKAPIYIHKNGFKKFYGTENGAIETENCGIRWSSDEYDRIRNRLIFTDDAVFIDDNTVISGNAIVQDEDEKTEDFFFKDKHGNYVKDDMSHEQCLAISECGSTYLFSGCSHKGVMSVIRFGKAMFPDNKIALLVAGMHLYKADNSMVDRIADRIMEENVECVIPVHCTGINALCRMRSVLGDRCIPAVTGYVYSEDEGNEEKGQ